MSASRKNNPILLDNIIDSSGISGAIFFAKILTLSWYTNFTLIVMWLTMLSHLLSPPLIHLFAILRCHLLLVILNYYFYFDSFDELQAYRCLPVKSFVLSISTKPQGPHFIIHT